MQHLQRQIKEIHQQATLLLAKEEITPEEINFFHQYSEELKANIKETVKDDMIRSLASEIPDDELLEAVLSAKRVEFWDLDLMGLFKSGENRTAKDLIRLANAKYAAIEMLLVNTTK